jgi:ribose 5-phosphate isomerase
LLDLKEMSETVNIKKECAREALKLIPPHAVIGLGGGSTIGYLIDFIRETPELDVRVVTPSVRTKWLCREKGLYVLPTETVNHLTIAFDGCDQVDEKLHALKSGGGIHTKEKLVASMADDYVLLVDESKFVPRLTFQLPVVLEIFDDALAYVKQKVSGLGGEPAMRTSNAKDGFTVSDYGHPLMDVTFHHVEDIDTLNRELNAISGVIGTSLFTDVVTKALVAGENGFNWISKKP